MVKVVYVQLHNLCHNDLFCLNQLNCLGIIYDYYRVEILYSSRYVALY